MEFGETPDQTLIREFKEELNIVPVILHPNPIVTTNTWLKNKAGHGANAHVLLLTYIVDIGMQIPQNIDPDHETGEMKWYSRAEIKTLDCLPNTHFIIDRAQEIIDDL